MSFDAIAPPSPWFNAAMERASDAADGVRPVRVGPPQDILWIVQVMRGAAALMVVAGHSQSTVARLVAHAGGHFTRSALIPWGASVDLFFVISGFIIVHASLRLFGLPDARTEFLRRRLARIVPLYWLITTLFLALLAAATLKGGDAFPLAIAILASYAFVPFDTFGVGHFFPVYDLGWTLNYEIMFYVLLTLVVAWPKRRALTLFGLTIVLLVGMGAVIDGPSPLWFWTRPIIVDFGLGVVVAALMDARVRLDSRARIGLALMAMAVLLADPVHIFDGPSGLTVANEWPRVLMAGVPVAILMAAAVLGPQPAMPRIALPLTHLGDASYSLYLFHPFVLIVTEKLEQKLLIPAAMPGWLLATTMIAASIALALVGYRWVERPLTAAVGDRLRARARPIPVAASVD